MPLHFTETELTERRQRALDLMMARGLEGLLMFRQESMYYLTGYDTFGYVFFQCLYLGADGRMTLLTRAPDLRQAQHTSVIQDIRVWIDAPDADPSQDLREILEEHQCHGRRLGVEFEAYGLTARNGQRLTSALENFCSLTDASDLISELRVIKSPAEIQYVRQAAELADRALVAAHAHAKPGAFEGDILAAMQSEIFAGGGDFPANEVIIGSGPGALLCRYFSGRRHLEPDDQLTLEFAGVYRHYHACLMRTLVLGRPNPQHLPMYEAALEALEAAKEALQPGQPIGKAFDAHARALDAAGLREHRLNACGYSLGSTFSPNWMDWPMLYHDNPTIAQPNMVFFIHIIIADSVRGLGMTTGQTVLVTETGCEVITKGSLEFRPM
jgi:Xaa-Pro dipeptidase